MFSIGVIREPRREHTAQTVEFVASGACFGHGFGNGWDPLISENGELVKLSNEKSVSEYHEGWSGSS